MCSILSISINLISILKPNSISFLDTIDVHAVQSVTFQIRTEVMASLLWKIAITQVPCSETPGRLWPTKGAKTGINSI